LIGNSLYLDGQLLDHAGTKHFALELIAPIVTLFEDLKRLQHHNEALYRRVHWLPVAILLQKLFVVDR